MNIPLTNEILTFTQVAYDLSKLPYDPDDPAPDGSVLIGCLQAADGSVSRWSAVPLGHTDGYALLVEYLAHEVDADYDPVWLDEAEQFYMLPVSGRPGVIETTPDMPGAYASAAAAFEAFVDLVYADEHTEAFFELTQEALDVIDGYCDPWGAPFSEFKGKVFAASDVDPHTGLWTRSVLANAMLCARYPFLIPWQYGDDVCPWGLDEQPFTRTGLDVMPNGWARAFGLEMCEDLRNQAYDARRNVWEWRLCSMRPDQIKEKFGELRWYGSAFGRGQDLIEVYSDLSRDVCVKTGTADGVRITGGWISPFFWKETLPSDKTAIHKAAEERYLDDPDGAGWDERHAAHVVGEYAAALEATCPAEGSDEVLGMLKDIPVKVFDSQGEHVENSAKGLLDGSKAPNGEPVWAAEVIKKIAAEIAQREARPVDAEVAEAMGKLKIDKDVVGDWWSAPSSKEDM